MHLSSEEKQKGQREIFTAPAEKAGWHVSFFQISPDLWLACVDSHICHDRMDINTAVQE